MQSFGDGENPRMNDFGPKHSTPVKTRTCQQQPHPDYASPSAMQTAHKNTSKTTLNKGGSQWASHCKAQECSDDYSSPDNSPKPTNKASVQHLHHQETKDGCETGYDRCRPHSLPTAYNTSHNKYNGGTDNDKGYTVLQKQSGTWFVSPKGMFGQISGDGKAVTNMSSVLSDTIAWSPGSTAAFLEQDIINKQRHEMQILMEELGIRDQELNDLVSSHQKQVQAWEAEREKFSNLHARLRSYEEELMKNDKQLKETLKEMALVNEQREADSLEFKRTQDEMEKLADRISENSHYIKEMEFQNKSLKNTIKELMAEQADKEKREHELMKTIEDKDKLLSDKKAEINQLNDHMKYFESRCEELEEKNLNVATEMNSWKRKYCQAKDEADKLTAQNTEKEECNQKMTLQLQESLQQAVALQKALFTSCEREKCKEEVMYSLRKQHKRTMQELQNIRELYDRQNRDLTLYHLSVKEKIDKETAKKESEQVHQEKLESKVGALKHLKGDKNMSSHKDRVSNSTQESEESTTYLIKNRCRQEASHEEVTEDADSTSYKTEACNRSSHTTRCYNVATTTSSTTQLSEDRDSSLPRSRPSTSLGISKTSTWGSSSIQTSSRYSRSRSTRSSSDPRPCHQKRAMRSKTTSPILTRYPFAYRHCSKTRRKSRDKTEVKTEESCSSTGSHLLSPLHYDSLSPADSDGMCQELKRDITKICVEAFDVSPSTEKSKQVHGAKPSSLKQLPTAISNPSRSSFLKKERVEKRISFSADDDEITATTAPSLSKKSLELATKNDRWSRASLHKEAQGDYMLSPSAIENECSHNSPLVKSCDKDDSAYCKQIKHYCEGKTQSHNHCRSKSSERKTSHCTAIKKSAHSMQPHKPCSEYCKCFGYKISPPSQKKQDQCQCKLIPGETKPPLSDNKLPSQKCLKTLEKNPSKSFSKPNPRTKQPDEDRNLSTNGNPNSPTMDDQQTINSHSEDPPVKKSLTSKEKKATPQMDKKKTSSPEPSNATEPQTSSRKSFLENYHPSFHGLRRSIIGFIYPSSENGNNKVKKEKKSPGTETKVSSQMNFTESENEQSSQTKSYTSEQEEQSDKKRKYSEKKQSLAYENSTHIGDRSETLTPNDSIRHEKSGTIDSKSRASSLTRSGSLTTKEWKPSSTATSTLLIPPVRDSFSGSRPTEILKERKASDIVVERALYTELNATESQMPKKSIYNEEETLYTREVSPEEKLESEMPIQNSEIMEVKPSVFSEGGLTLKPDNLEEETITFSDRRQTKRYEDQIVKERKISFVEHRSSIPGYKKASHRDSNTSPFVTMSPTVKGHMSMAEDDELRSRKSLNRPSTVLSVPSGRPSEKIISTKSSVNAPVITVEEDIVYIEMPPEDGQEKKIFSFSNRGVNVPPESMPRTSSIATPGNTTHLHSHATPGKTPRSASLAAAPSLAATQVNTPHSASHAATPANTPHSSSHAATPANTPHSASHAATPANTPHSASHAATPANTPHSASYAATPVHTPRLHSIAMPINMPRSVSYDASVVHEDEENKDEEKEDDEEDMAGKVSRAISCNMEKLQENKRTSSFISYDDKNLNDMPVKISRAVSCSVGAPSESGKRSTFTPFYGGENLDEMPSKVSRAVSCNAGDLIKSEKRSLSFANIEDIPSKKSCAVSCNILESPQTRKSSSKYTYPDKGIDVDLDRMSQKYDDLINSWVPDHGDITKKRSWKSQSHRTNQDLTYVKCESPSYSQTLKMCRKKSPVLEISPGRHVDCSPHREKIKSRGSPPLSGFFLKKNKKMKITVQYSDDEYKDSSDESCMPETSFSIQDDSDDFSERPCSSCKKDKHKRCKCITSNFLKNKPELFKHHGIYSCKDKGARPEREFGFGERMLRSCGKTSPIKEEHFSFQKIFQRNMSDSFWEQPKSLCGLLSSPKDNDFFDGSMGIPSSKYKGSKVDPFLGQHMYSGKGGASYLPSDVKVYLSQNRKLYCNNNKSLEVYSQESPDEPLSNGPMIDKLDLGPDMELGLNTCDNNNEVACKSSGHKEASTNGSNVLDSNDGQTRQVEDKVAEKNFFYTEATSSSSSSFAKCVMREEAKTAPGKVQPNQPFTTFRGPSLYKRLSQIHFSEKSNRYEWVDGTEKSMNGCINLVSAARPPSILLDSRDESENAQRSNFELLAGFEKCDKSLDSGHHSLSGGFLESVAVGSSRNINNNNLKLSDDSCVDSPAASDLFRHQPLVNSREIHPGGSLYSQKGHPYLESVVRRLSFEDTSSLSDDLASFVLDRTFRLDQKGTDVSESGCGHDRKEQNRDIAFCSFAMPPSDCKTYKATNIPNEQSMSPIQLQCKTKDCNGNVNSSEISEADHPSLAEYFKDISTLIVGNSDVEKSISVNDEADEIVNATIKGFIDTTDSTPETQRKALGESLSDLAPEMHEAAISLTQAEKGEISQDRLLGYQCENFLGNYGNLVFHKWPEIQMNTVDGWRVADKNVSGKLLVDNSKKIFNVSSHENNLVERGFDPHLVKQWAVQNLGENEVRDTVFALSEPSTQFIKITKGPRISQLQSVLSHSDSDSLIGAATISQQNSAANGIITTAPGQDTGTKVPDWLEEEIAELPDNLFGKEPPSAVRREPADVASSLWKDHLRPQISPSTRLHRLLIQSQQMIHLLEHSSAIPETIKLEVSMSYKS